MRVKIASPLMNADLSRLVYDPKGLKGKSPSPHGIYSNALFGSMNTDIPSCKCGTLIGESNIGVTCIQCDTNVIEASPKLKENAYVYLDGYHIINPQYFDAFKLAFGKEAFYLYISLNNKPIIQYKTSKKVIFEPNAIGKGLIYFYENFETICKFHLENAHNDYVKLYFKTFLKVYQEDKSQIFMDYVCIINSRLRLATFVGGNLLLDPINSEYTSILSLVEFLRSLSKYERIDSVVLPILSKIQFMQIKLSDIIFEKISSKNGDIRSSKIGREVEFSSRVVISPLEKEDIDVVEIPYLVAVIMLEPFILNNLVAIRKISFNEAYSYYIREMLKFSNENYAMLINVIRNLNIDKENYLHVLINRPPTINLGSILKVKAKIKRNSQMTMNISNLLHTFLSSDYDGGAVYN